MRLNKKESIKKSASLSQIAILVIAIFAFAYILHESSENPEDNGLKDSQKDSGTLGRIIHFILNQLRKPIIQQVSAQSLNCCPETNLNDTCMDFPDTECSSQCSQACIPSQCKDFASCKKGCCIDTTEGICTSKSSKAKCEADGGTWKDTADCNLNTVPECKFGCCVLGSNVEFVTSQRCTKLAGELNLKVDFRAGITSEDSCVLLSMGQVRGACILNDNSCKMLTNSECNSLTGRNIAPGYLCTAVDLNTTCHPTSNTMCVDGKDEVYFQDSCGNAANIYDSSMINNQSYWEKIVGKFSSCGAFDSRGNVNSKSCGNCDRYSGSSCKNYQDAGAGKPNSGNFVCADLSCKSAPSVVDASGNILATKDRQNGESWCIYDSKIGSGDDVPGSRHFKYSCIDSEVKKEPCADARNEICVESKIAKNMSNAVCRANNWRNCFDVNLTDCGTVLDCYRNRFAIDNFAVDLCMPNYPGGFGRDDSNQQSAQEICSQATRTCVVKFKSTGFFSKSCKCVENCGCEDAGFTQQMNDVCRKLGDCGGEANIAGVYSGNYAVSGAPNLDQRWITTKLVSLARVVPGLVASPGNVTVELEAAGINSNSVGQIKGYAGITQSDLWNQLNSVSSSSSSSSITGSVIAMTGMAAAPFPLYESSGRLVTVFRSSTPGDIVMIPPSEVPANAVVLSPGTVASSGLIGSGVTTAPAATTMPATAPAGEEVIQSSITPLGSDGTPKVPITPQDTTMVGPPGENTGIGISQTATLGGFIGGVVGGIVGGILGSKLAQALGLNPTGTFLMSTGMGLIGASLGGAAGTSIVTGTAFVKIMMTDILPKLLPGFNPLTIIIIGAVMVIVSLFFMGGGKCPPKQVTFTCMPWQAPVGGADCSKCNNGEKPCSKYRCESLGQACQMLNEGTGKEICQAAKNDGKAPVITPWLDILGANFSYTNISSNGFQIREKSGGCIQSFTPVLFGINTDEAAQCKIDLVPTNKPEDMEEYFGGSNLFEYNHSQIFSMPSVESLINYVNGTNLSADYVINKLGNLRLYVRCQDMFGNYNPAEYFINICVSAGPDKTPPYIVATNPANGAMLQNSKTEQNVNIFVNEPATCRYSKQDKTYDNMENNFSCETDLGMQQAFGWQCASNFSGLTKGENSFYIRCKDQPWLEGTVNASKRNANTQGYLYKLKVSETPLTITRISPNGTVRVGSEPAVVDLHVDTAGGAENGKAVCSYNWGGNWIVFLNTVSTSHSQPGLNLFGGSYDIPIRCEDAAGNVEESTASFSIDVDSVPPGILRIYNSGGNLYLFTNENADCVYSTTSNSCNFVFENGTVMDGGFTQEHWTAWDTSKTYYIKCRDVYKNEPNGCSIKARAYNKVVAGF